MAEYQLWVELDETGELIRASDGVRQHLQPMYGTDLGLPALVRSRADLAAALRRRAGDVRIALGHGAMVAQYDLLVTQGGQGARCVLSEAGDQSLPDALDAWAHQSREGVVLADADFHILWANQAFCQLVGYTEAEVVGRYLSVFRTQRMSERQRGFVDRALLGRGYWAGELPFRRFDGTEFPAWATYTALRDPAHRTTHHLVCVSDITENEEAERQENLDASAALIGRLSRGFAHDLNNLAGELFALVESAQESGQLNAGGLTHLDRIAGAMGLLGRQLLTLATHNAEAPPTDLNRLARDLAWLLNRASNRTRQVEVAADAEPLWAEVQSDALLRTVLPAALRAITELPMDRGLLISTEGARAEAILRLTYEADPTERERLRALFPETGLSTITSNALLTRAMAAGVEFRLEVGQGGQVSICASCRRTEAQGPAAPPPSATPAAQTGRALVVEDNEALQELVVHALRRDFPATVSAKDGVDGLEALERVQGQVDIVIVDLMMPRMTGLEFLRRARARWPHLKVIVVSGAASAEQVREARVLGASLVLAKPFRVSELWSAVRAAIGPA